MIVLILIAIISLPPFYVQASAEPAQIGDRGLKGDERIISGEYIIKLKDWGDESARNAIFDPSTKIRGDLEKIKALRVEVSEKSRESFLQKIHKNKNVVWVEPNYIIEVESIPNDPLWSEQWSPKKIAADAAWDLGYGSQDVLVIVVDTGVYYTHPDLASNYVAGGYDWVNKDNDPLDDNGHGTHCAGIVAAAINNGEGIAGLAQVKIMAEKFLSSAGSGSSWDAAQAIIHAVDVGKTISNRMILSNSWGSSSSSSAVRDAMQYAYQNGALIVAAAGNSHSSDPFYPAAYPEVISVSTTDLDDNLATFSNYGSTIELAAPGVSIYSTYLNNGYRSMSGTSMACPHVSGVAALLWSRFPGYTNDLVRTVLYNTADDLGQVGWDQYYGYGRVNAYRAVQGGQPHDIRVAEINMPPLIFTRDTVKIGGIIQNIGNNTESNVNVQLIVDNALIATKSISTIQVSEKINLEFDWTPSNTGTYNTTVYALPVEGESSISNNQMSRTASVKDHGQILVVSDDDGTHIAGKETSINEITSALTKNGYSFSVWSESAYGRPSLSTLLEFRLVIWTCGYYWNWAVDQTDADTLMQYLNNGRSILLEGEDVASNHVNDNFLTNVAHASFQIDDVGSSGLTVTELSHPICKEIPPSFSWMTRPLWEDGVAPLDGGKEAVKYTGISYSAVVTSGNGGSGSTVYIAFPVGCLEEDIREKIIVNSVEWLQAPCLVRVESKNPEIVGLKVYVNKIAYLTPASVNLRAGLYCFAVYPTWTDGVSEYVFDHWEDEIGRVISTTILFTYNIQDNRTIYACFRQSTPSCLNISVSEIGNISRGEEFELNVTVTNSGLCPINDLLVKLIHSSNITIRYGELERFNIASISPGQSYTLTWHITCNDIGTLRIIATANGRDQNGCPVVNIVRLNRNVVN